MFYFYSNGKLISESTDFSEVFGEFFSTLLYLGLDSLSQLDRSFYHLFLQNECVHDLILFSAYWYKPQDYEFAIFTDLENHKYGKQKV